MRFVSTRGRDVVANLSRAMADGIAPDGGLYVPEHLPELSLDGLAHVEGLESIARHLLAPFASGDALEQHLDAICRHAFNFPAPLVRLNGTPGPASALELFHGPTCAFKDFGARFLAASLERIHQGDRKLTVLVATSGDTGGAVAAAFHKVRWADVVLLYPKGRVSPSQAQQLACWGNNVWTFAVPGTFDDCQRMVKEAFRDPALAATHLLSSANSINVGRLLPQMVYYADASLQIWRKEGRKPNFIIPTGNLGNAAACVLAREIGLPIGAIVLATNENRTIVDYLDRGTWQPRPAVATLSSAMDVASPSNMERMRWLFPDLEQLRLRVTAHSVSDDEVRSAIRSDADSIGRVWCPHTATAAHVYRQLAHQRPDEHWVIVATAHPAKFREIIEPLIGTTIPVPPALDQLFRLPQREQDLAPTLDALRHELHAL
jgi:threonine synthase